MIQNILTTIAKGNHYHYICVFHHNQSMICSDSLKAEFHLPDTCFVWDDLKHLIHPDDMPLFEEFTRSLLNASHLEIELRFRNRLGKIIPLHFMADYFTMEEGACSLIQIHNNYAKHYDAFTGLPDIMLCESDTNNYIDKPEIDQFILCVLSLQEPTVWHQEIPTAPLPMIGDLLRTVLPVRFQVYQIASYQFAIIATQCSPTTMQSWFHLLQKQLQTNSRLNIAGGFVSYPDDGDTWERLYRRVHYALHQAITDQSNTLCPFTLPLELHSVHQLQLMNKLQEAVHQQLHEFHLVYQPQVSMHCEVKGMEALLRWPHASPETFIPMLESTQMIKQLTPWLLTTACKDFSFLLLHYPNLTLSLNISYMQLCQSNFEELVIDKLTQFEIPTTKIILEITETAIAENFLEMKDRLIRLQNTGIQIAIDDFGTGYASLSFLRQMPIDILKIDRSFVSDIQTRPQDIHFIRLICEIAHEIQCHICLEGVETQAELDAIHDLGIDTIQGYYYSRPLNLADLSQFLAHFPNKKHTT